MAALLFIASYLWPALRSLRGYFLVMGAILFLSFGVDPFIKQTIVWQNLFAGQSQMVILLGERVLLVLETLVVLSILLLIGERRRDAFLAVGNLRAPVWRQTSAAKGRNLTRLVFGTGMAVLLASLFFAFLTSQTAGGMAMIAAAFPWLPLILLSAALNAFSEEVMYRAVPLGMLLPAVGAGHALWLASLWFGLGWSLIIHVSIDTVIYIFIAVTMS